MAGRALGKSGSGRGQGLVPHAPGRESAARQKFGGVATNPDPGPGRGRRSEVYPRSVKAGQVRGAWCDILIGCG